MSMSAAKEGECCFCFCKGDNLVDPRVLPCGHLTCTRCLHGQSGQKNIECYTCKAKHEITSDTELPVYGKGGPLCDVCVNSCTSKQPAAIYCRQCNRKFCVSHRQSFHDVIFGEYQTTDVTNYQDIQNISVGCDKHKDQPLTGGCEICHQFVCGQCVFEPTLCPDGSSHQLKAISDLVKTLKSHVSELKDKLMRKEEELSSLFKETSKCVAKFEEETKDMIRQLRVCRDKQIEAITVKYDEMEKEIIDKRNAIQSKMVEYLEEDVGKGWADVSNERMMIEERIQQADDVTLIARHRDTRNDIQELVEKTTPTLKVQGVVALAQKAEQREIEVEIISTKDVHIGHRHELSVPKVLPRTLSLLKSVDVSSRCFSVCCDGGKTYAGCVGGHVDVIDKTYQLTKSYIKLSGHVYSVRVYNNRLYALVYTGGNPEFKVEVTDLSGKRVNSWPHAADTCSYASKLAVVSDQVIVPDRSNKRLTIYSLDGKIIKHIPCALSTKRVGLCTAGTDSVIVSDRMTSSVWRVDITSGELMWTCKAVQSPVGVVCSPSGYVYVHSMDTCKIYLLNIDTGELMSQLSDDIMPGDVCDLEVDGDRLIVPNYSSCKVLFYQLTCL